MGFVLSSMIILGNADSLAAAFNSVDKCATKFVIGHGQEVGWSIGWIDRTQSVSVFFNFGNDPRAREREEAAYRPYLNLSTRRMKTSE
jgi:hypothetical protein